MGNWLKPIWQEPGRAVVEPRIPKRKTLRKFRRLILWTGGRGEFLRARGEQSVMGQSSVSLTKPTLDVVIESEGLSSWALTRGSRLSLMGMARREGLNGRHGHPLVYEVIPSPSRRPTTSELALKASSGVVQ